MTQSRALSDHFDYNGESRMSRMQKELGGTLMLVMSLILGLNLHFCMPKYELPNGKTCLVCPSLTDSHALTIESNTDADISSSHGDCHDCCKLESCHEDGTSKAQSFLAGVSFVVDLPTPTLTFVDGIQLPNHATMPFLAGAPSTGPPSTDPSRAPPFFSIA